MKYSKYPSYRDSGTDWLGKIPSEWLPTRLKYCLSSIVAGGTPKTTNDEYWTESGDGTPWVSIADMTKNDIITETKKDVTLDGILEKNLKVLPEGTILYSIFASLGKVAFAGTPLTTNQAILGLVPNTKIDKAFFYWVLVALEGYVKFTASSNTQDNLNSEKVSNFPVSLPLQEQKTIANYLDKATGKIDTLIAKQTRLIELLKEKRQATVDSAIHHQDTLDMRIGRVVHQMLRPVNRVSNEEYEALGLYNRGRGLFHKPKKESNELGDSDFYWVEHGDLIISGQFAWEGAVALASEHENHCVVSHRYPLIRGKEELMNTEYLWAYFTTREGDFILNEHSIGSAGRNRPLNLNTLLKENIPVPAIEEQLKVARIVKSEKEIKILIDKEINLLNEKRTALISAAVTGKIDVREIA